MSLENYKGLRQVILSLKSRRNEIRLQIFFFTKSLKKKCFKLLNNELNYYHLENKKC